MIGTAYKIANKLGLSRTLLHAGMPRTPIILMYHGVTSLPRAEIFDWEGKHVDATVFRQQLTLIASTRRVVPLTRLVEALRANEDTAQMVAITFDDGYLNNVRTAAQILGEFGLPATFFLASGFVDDNSRWLWNDRIECAMHRTTLPNVILPWESQARLLASVEQRRQTLRVIKSQLKKLPWADAEQQVVKLERLLEVEQSSPSGVHEFMSWDDARQLVAKGFTVGAHTVNHAILSRVTLPEAQQEILASSRKVEVAAGSCSPVFCYPNGKRNDYTPQIVDWCRQHFVAALTAEFGSARGCDLFELRRIAVDNSTHATRLAGLLLQAA